MVSSVRQKIIDQIRTAKRGVQSAVEKGVESANDSIQRVQADIGGLSSKASSSDSVEPKKEVKKTKPKAKAKKSAKKSAGRSDKKV
tara:strand:+ start:328 stop:585 length:258 start_codon:yes stop_codon:yes gene_type:complete